MTEHSKTTIGDPELNALAEAAVKADVYKSALLQIVLVAGEHAHLYPCNVLWLQARNALVIGGDLADPESPA